MLTVAMDTMYVFHSANKVIIEDKTSLHFFSWAPINNLAPIKNCPGEWKVGQIRVPRSIRDIT